MLQKFQKCLNLKNSIVEKNFYFFMKELLQIKKKNLSKIFDYYFCKVRRMLQGLFSLSIQA